MKMSPAMRTAWAERIRPLDTPANREAYRTGQFPRSELTKDVDKRYRWDVLHAAVGSAGICSAYDEGLNDTHIDTALRAIVAPLNLNPEGTNTMHTVSSNHWSTDMQACDAMAWLRLNHPVEYSALASEFEHVTLPGTSCWFADAYPELDPEYGCWLIEAIEATGLVWWEEGEPWAGERNEEEEA